MNENTFLPKIGDEEKYHDEDYLMSAFIKKDPEEIEKIKKIQGLSDKQVQLFSDFAVLRDETVKEMNEEIVARKEIDSKPSEEELLLGAYFEQIEPQVRDTVVKLRRKGYNTYESGFGDFDSQMISFKNEALSDFEFPEDLKKTLAVDGVDVEVKAKSITLKFREYKDAETIASLWSKVEEVMPDLGAPAPANEISAAQSFRAKAKS